MSISVTKDNFQEKLNQEYKQSCELLEINDEKINDTDLKEIIKILNNERKLKSINEIFIKNHSMTTEIFPLFLNLIKSSQNITSFKWKMKISLLSVHTSMYSSAIGKALEYNKQFQKEKYQESSNVKVNTNNQKLSVKQESELLWHSKIDKQNDEQKNETIKNKIKNGKNKFMIKY